MPKELVAWAKQHIEWTLGDGAAANPDGVLMMIVDTEGRAAMSVGPYEELEDTRLAALCEVQWTQKEQRNLDSFLQRMLHIHDIYRLKNLNYKDDIEAAVKK